MKESADFIDRVNVSRETLDKLRLYADLLTKWNPVINLVSRSTINEIWTRHFLDSAVAFDSAMQRPGRWVDLGSGAGFPGLVLAILANEALPDAKVTCIETDIRKSEFLKTVARATGIQVNVFSRRIEETPQQNAQVITARALTSLDNLLNHAERHLAGDGIAVFHKGLNWRSEIEEAQKGWTFSYEALPSWTNDEAVLLKVGEISRV